MTQRNAKPLKWHGKGVSDTLDGSTVFNGAMAALTNLVPDPSTAQLWQCRPAATKLVDFNALGTYGTVGFVSCYKVIGDFVYGMMASSTLVPGYDIPFCFNLATGNAVVVGGPQNATTLPLSPPSSGAWTPPQMDVISTKVMVAHSGFNGAGGNFIGWFDISTPSSPIWNAGTMGGAVSFTVAPTSVAQFNGRAYYIHNASTPGVIFSDVLNPINCTNGNQVLTLNDNQSLTTIGKMPLNNQLGGIVQSLMVFKDDSNIFQITGDALTNNLSVNSLNVATGTQAPLSVVATPKGLVFVAPDGLRLITYTANVTDPIGIDGKGVSVPFIYAVTPTRISSACNGNYLRISVQNGNAATSPNQEYWYDIARQIWTGPHQFSNSTAASLLQPYKNTFIITPIGVNASLWQSDVQQSSTSTFTENGTALTWTWTTPLLPDTDEITNNAMTESTIDLALASGVGTVTVSAIDQNASVINSVTLTPSAAATVWGQFTWGAAPWGGVGSLLAPYELQWSIPIVFSRMSISASASSVFGFKIGALHMLYQRLRIYTNTAAAA